MKKKNYLHLNKRNIFFEKFEENGIIKRINEPFLLLFKKSKIYFFVKFDKKDTFFCFTNHFYRKCQRELKYKSVYQKYN